MILSLVPCQQGDDSEGDKWLLNRKARLPVVEVDCEMMCVQHVGRKLVVLVEERSLMCFLPSASLC